MKLMWRLLDWINSLSIPIILILLAVRIMLTPLYINVEYRMPGFPVDPYGFNFDDRMYWADISRQYLLNREDISFLLDQRLDDETPLYNQRELRHMYDVKVVLNDAIYVLYGSLVYLVLHGIWSKRAGRSKEFLFAISLGGWITAGFIIMILVYLAFNFNSLFTNFHRIFFEGDTWLFKFSDTLIRLFPVRFWRDAFIWIGSFALLVGVRLGFLGKKRK